MAYHCIKTIKGRKYLYWQRSFRKAGRVCTESRYIGPASSVYYHATRETFDTFDMSKAGSNTGWANASFGIFFSDNKEATLEFARDNATSGEERPVNLKTVCLSLKNPLDLTIEGLFDKAAQAPLIVKLLGGEELCPEDALAYLNENIDLSNLPDLYEEIYRSLEHKTTIQQHGYDGIISQFGRDEQGNTIKEYVAFDTSQIEILS